MSTMAHRLPLGRLRPEAALIASMLVMGFMAPLQAAESTCQGKHLGYTV
jgi:hypothetical protein